jgi:hypothetical protein
LIDVGCGNGDSTLLFTSLFNLPVIGVNNDNEEVKRCKKRGLNVIKGNAEEGEVYVNGGCVVAVDCCYHWDKNIWYETMFKRGVKHVAATDFVVKEEVGKGWKWILEKMGEAAGIQRGNFLTRKEYRDMLEGMGYRNVRIDTVEGTLEGFGEFTKRRVRECERRGMRGEGYGRIMDDLKSKGEAIGMAGEYLEYVVVAAEGE